jgi:Tfp pilus assembly protein PilO
LFRQGGASLKNKEQMQKIALVAIVLFGIIYVYFSNILSPQWDKITQLEQQKLQRQALLQKLTIQKEHLAKLQQQISDDQVLIKKGSVKVPAAINKPQLTVDIYNLAKQHGISPDNLRFDKIQNKGTYQEMGIDFTGSGQITDILSFIRDIQKSQDLITIQNISLTAQTNNVQTSMIQPTATQATGTQPNGIQPGIVQTGGMKVDISLVAYSTTGIHVTPKKPAYMNYPFGITSILKLFS